MFIAYNRRPKGNRKPGTEQQHHLDTRIPSITKQATQRPSVKNKAIRTAATPRQANKPATTNEEIPVKMDDGRGRRHRQKTSHRTESRPAWKPKARGDRRQGGDRLKARRLEEAEGDVEAGVKEGGNGLVRTSSGELRTGTGSDGELRRATDSDRHGRALASVGQDTTTGYRHGRARASPGQRTDTDGGDQAQTSSGEHRKIRAAVVDDGETLRKGGVKTRESEAPLRERLMEERGIRGRR